ncbi:SDR family NAD(P)-dependent oxidoreductase [Streptomyces sp. 8L]|uniref:SDR family NAD(P)-dependent oxidoreductase n=1 Tax=Streptomyces sp. 8L TaxID=2877242 RepID=UPI001CD6AD84|nr:SDR family oxidoreductase [Streptomyces sp. 8L]MCA1219316.1 SDR family oxidoreductase [Streptomyces sp. 8L]
MTPRTAPSGPPSASGRHVLVTGAAGGIGAAVCAAFAQDGCTVTASDLPSAALTDLADRLAGDGTTAHALPADLADPDAAATLVERATGLAGPPDVLVNAAGIYPATPLTEMTAEIWDRVLDINVRAAMLTSAALARVLTAAGAPGSIVNITSGAALRARFGAAHYSASKAALEMLTRACAVEFGPHGIRVNAVSPGFVTVDSAVNPVTEAYAAAVSVNPLGRPGDPDDIARAVRWVAGPEASWMTGSVVRLDGGASAGTTTLPRHWPELSGTQAGTAAGEATR